MNKGLPAGLISQETMIFAAMTLHPPDLTDDEIAEIGSRLYYGRPINGSLPWNLVGRATKKKHIKYNIVPPNTQIVRLMEKQYVDSFFETGTLRLSTFDSFRKATNEQVRDELEGVNVLALKNSENIMFQRIQ